MDEGALPPEVWLDLKIKLDRLRTLEDRCRDALARLAEGELTADAYVELVHEQVRAQKDWEERHKKIFGAIPRRRGDLRRLMKVPERRAIDPIS